ncbi:hypothetical protein MMC31_007638 [Peltigera leucophlebia]|nr:hypothetical protein [Peltigera leucophlebia]
MSITIGHLAHISGREVEQLLQTFNAQPAVVHSRFLEIVFFLGNEILPRETITSYAALLALSDEQEGEITEQWLLLRILAWSFHVFLFCPLPGCHDIWCFYNADESDFEGWDEADLNRRESGQRELKVKEDMLSLLKDDESDCTAGKDRNTFCLDRDDFFAVKRGSLRIHLSRFTVEQEDLICMIRLRPRALDLYATVLNNSVTRQSQRRGGIGNPQGMKIRFGSGHSLLTVTSGGSGGWWD